MAIKGTDNGYGTIHAAAEADLVNYNYFRVYAGADAVPTINGTTVTMAASSTVDVYIRTITPTADVFVIGEPINAIDGNTTLSRYPNPS